MTDGACKSTSHHDYFLVYSQDISQNYTVFGNWVRKTGNFEFLDFFGEGNTYIEKVLIRTLVTNLGPVLISVTNIH